MEQLGRTALCSPSKKRHGLKFVPRVFSLGTPLLQSRGYDVAMNYSVQENYSINEQKILFTLFVGREMLSPECITIS